MSEFERLMTDENIEKYDDVPLPATPLQGRVREALEKGLERTSTEVKREIIQHQRMRGMYSALDKLGTRCSWERVMENGIFKRRLD